MNVTFTDSFLREFEHFMKEKTQLEALNKKTFFRVVRN